MKISRAQRKARALYEVLEIAATMANVDWLSQQLATRREDGSTVGVENTGDTADAYAFTRIPAIGSRSDIYVDIDTLNEEEFSNAFLIGVLIHEVLHDNLGYFAQVFNKHPDVNGQSFYDIVTNTTMAILEALDEAGVTGVRGAYTMEELAQALKILKSDLPCAPGLNTPFADEHPQNVNAEDD